MATDKSDGGAAFPACNEANVNGTMGMSLRDWFAGQALAQAVLEDPSTCSEMKADIRAWFDAGEPVTVPTLTEEERDRLKTIAEEILGYAGHDAPWLKRRATEALSLISKLTNQEPTP